MKNFPTRYLRLTTRLLAQMKETMPEPVVRNLLNQIAEDLAQEYEGQMKGLSMEERLDFVKTMLGEEALPLNGKRRASSMKSTKFHAHITRSESAIQSLHRRSTLISKMLAVPAEKVQWILSGGTFCTYVVQLGEPQDDKST